MSEQFKDLIQSFSAMNPAKQEEFIREIRETREIVRPAVAKKRKKKEVQKAGRAKNKIEKIMSGMTDEQKAELKKLLEAKNG